MASSVGSLLVSPLRCSGIHNMISLAYVFDLGFLVVFTVFTFFTLILGCIPIAANWDFTLRPPPIGTGNAKCLSIPAYRAIALANSSTSYSEAIVVPALRVLTCCSNEHYNRCHPGGHAHTADLDTSSQQTHQSLTHLDPWPRILVRFAYVAHDRVQSLLGISACGAGVYKTPLLYRFFDNIDSTGEGAWYYAWQM